MALTKEQIKKIVGYAATIIFANEGFYESVNKNDNGAVSVGKVQWHANRALALLKTICAADAVQAKSILGSTLYSEIINAFPNAWTSRTVTATEAATVSTLLITAEGRQAQDNLAESDINAYINKGLSYGLTDHGALIYFADGVNQYGTASALWKNISLKAIETTGDLTAMFTATKALTSNYIARRTKVYNAVSALNLPANQKGETVMAKTNIGLAVHAEKALKEGWYYLWGASAQIATKGVIDSNIRQYPDNERWRSYATKAIGKTRVCDCYGLVKSYLWWTDSTKNPKYNAAQDVNTTSAFNKAKEKGTLNTLPEMPGIILWRNGHVGVYIENGRFIECAGSGKGMIEGKIERGKIVKDSKFTHWFKDINIEYIGLGEEGEDEVVKQIEIMSNGQKVTVDAINKNDYNFIKIQDLKKIKGLAVGWDGKHSIINTKQ